MAQIGIFVSKSEKKTHKKFSYAPNKANEVTTHVLCPIHTYAFNSKATSPTCYS